LRSELELPDVQSGPSLVPIRVGKVGLYRIRVPLTTIHVGGGVWMVQRPLVSVYVDLPEGQRAIHASRSYQAVFDVWSRAQEGRVRLEDLCASIATELLSRHSYSSRASCELSGELFRIVEAPRSMNRSYESVGVWAYASARRSGGVETRRGVGVRVNGVTACPCAQEVVRTLAGLNGPGGSRLSEVAGTHMQRTIATVRLLLTDGSSVDLLELADIVKKCMSGSTYDLLKRIDEGELVVRALSNPLFAEDVVRLIASSVRLSFGFLAPQTRIIVEVRSIESLHNYDIMAHLSATLGELDDLRSA
jgi:GTP cyclohydrolase-4